MEHNISGQNLEIGILATKAKESENEILKKINVDLYDRAPLMQSRLLSFGLKLDWDGNAFVNFIGKKKVQKSLKSLNLPV